MLDRSQVDAAVYRVAVAAFTYYPDRPQAEPGYTIDEDLDWCLRPLHRLPQAELEVARERIHALITDPAGDRQGFIRYLNSLADL